MPLVVLMVIGLALVILRPGRIVSILALGCFGYIVLMMLAIAMAVFSAIFLYQMFKL